MAFLSRILSCSSGGADSSSDEWEAIPNGEPALLADEATVNFSRDLYREFSKIQLPVECGWEGAATVNLAAMQPATSGSPWSIGRVQSMRPPPGNSGDFKWTESRKVLEAAIAMEQLQSRQAPAGTSGFGETALAEERLLLRLHKLRLDMHVQKGAWGGVWHGWQRPAAGRPRRRRPSTPRGWPAHPPASEPAALDPWCYCAGDGNCQFRSISFCLYGAPRGMLLSATLCHDVPLCAPLACLPACCASHRPSLPTCPPTRGAQGPPNTTCGFEARHVCTSGKTWASLQRS